MDAVAAELRREQGAPMSDNFTSQTFDSRRDEFRINGFNPLGGTASDLADLQFSRAHALAVFAQQAFLDADIAEGTSDGSNLLTFSAEAKAMVMDTIAWLIAEGEFYREASKKPRHDRLKAA
jgi:hypothetical protein